MDNDEFKLDESGINPTDTTSRENKDIYFSNMEAAAEPEETKPAEQTAVVKRKAPKVQKGQSIAGTYIFFIVVIVVSMILSIYAVLCMNDVLAITKSSS